MLDRIKASVDRFQRAHAVTAVPVAVAKKFGEDKASQLAALLAYYGFFSLFPLLLAAAAILGFLLEDSPELRARVLDSVLSQLPIVGQQIRENLGELTGSGVPLVIGVAGAVWAGLGGMKALGAAMDRVWDVAVVAQPKFPKRSLKGLVMLAVLGAFSLAATGLSSIGTNIELPGIGRLVPFAGSLVLNVIVFLLAFRVLTAADVSWRDVLPGSVIAGIGWSLLQSLGSFLVGARLARASELYGFFGVVLGLLSFLYIGAQLTLVAAETNVVLARRLWPRALSDDDLGPTDRRALEMHVKAERRLEGQSVEVRFDEPGQSSGRAEDGSALQ